MHSASLHGRPPRPPFRPALAVAKPPLIDRRARIRWSQRLPARLSTGALWLGSLSLLGPWKLLAVLLIGGLLVPTVLWLDREPRHPRDGRPFRSLVPVTPPPHPAPIHPGRAPGSAGIPVVSRPPWPAVHGASRRRRADHGH
ncbi:MAG: hypothetical protein ACK6BG_00905 [Cyanobacteriota bacterium]